MRVLAVLSDFQNNLRLGQTTNLTFKSLCNFRENLCYLRSYLVEFLYVIAIFVRANKEFRHNIILKSGFKINKYKIKYSIQYSKILENYYA